jgi:hypothetical protein
MANVCGVRGLSFDELSPSCKLKCLPYLFPRARLERLKLQAYLGQESWQLQRDSTRTSA